MKPFPEQQVSAIEREQCDLRAEISNLRIQLENAKLCMMSLERKRQDLITEAREGDLFEQMFGETVSVPSIYTDTPIAEEVYGG